MFRKFNYLNPIKLSSLVFFVGRSEVGGLNSDDALRMVVSVRLVYKYVTLDSSIFKSKKIQHYCKMATLGAARIPCR